MKFQIKHRLTGKVLFEADRKTLRLTVEAAVEQKADLGGADLGGAYLGGAYLGGADLGGAYLGGAYLRGAYLGGAYLGGAEVIDTGQSKRGYRHFAVRHKEEGKPFRVIGGCHDFTLAEAREYWGPGYEGVADTVEINAKLDLIEAVAKARGWQAESEADS